VVLVARGQEALNATSREVDQAGGRAMVAPADVADWGQLDRVRSDTVARFGRIDAWVNNAGIAIYAPFHEVTPDEMKRIVEVNLLGEMYGTKAALEQMRSQGDGVIVNVSSALARRSVVLQSAYCAAKHGVTGFTESVRMEIEKDYPGIHLVEVLPSSIDTPLFAHARSKMGTKPMPIPPIYDPSVVAEAIVHALEKPQREIFAGGSGKFFEVGERISPPLVDAYLGRGDRGTKQQLTSKPDDGADNMFEPMPGPGDVTGDWAAESKRASAYTRQLEFHPGRKVALAAGSLAASMLAFWGLARHQAK
jgi:short-subunit dehydrogenase